MKNNLKRNQTLNEAESLINGARATDYGDAYDNHKRIADGWNVIARRAFESHGKIMPSHVALMMDWLKTSRLLNTIDHDDSWIDKAAYSSLGSEFSARDKDAKI